MKFVDLDSKRYRMHELNEYFNEMAHAGYKLIMYKGNRACFVESESTEIFYSAIFAEDRKRLLMTHPDLQICCENDVLGLTVFQGNEKIEFQVSSIKRRIVISHLKQSFLGIIGMVFLWIGFIIASMFPPYELLLPGSWLTARPFIATALASITIVLIIKAWLLCLTDIKRTVVSSSAHKKEKMIRPISLGICVFIILGSSFSYFQMTDRSSKASDVARKYVLSVPYALSYQTQSFRLYQLQKLTYFNLEQVASQGDAFYIHSVEYLKGGNHRDLNRLHQRNLDTLKKRAENKNTIYHYKENGLQISYLFESAGVLSAVTSTVDTTIIIRLSYPLHDAHRLTVEDIKEICMAFYK